MVKEAAIGFGIRQTAEFVVVGLIIDPFNRFLVPLSKGRLVTTQQAAANIAVLDFDLETATTVIVNPSGVLLSLLGRLPPIPAGTMAIVQVLGSLKEGLLENLDPNLARREGSRI